jgi:hypothetical protein
MAERLLAHWRDSVPLLLVTGASHATLDAQLEPKGETMAALLAGERAGLVPTMLKYDNSAPMPPAPITFQLREGTPACVPGLQSADRTAT